MQPQVATVKALNTACAANEDSVGSFGEGQQAGAGHEDQGAHERAGDRAAQQRFERAQKPGDEHDACRAGGALSRAERCHA